MPPYKILRRNEVENLIGLSRSAIYAAMDKGTFPRPIKLGARAVGWKLTDILAWLEAREVSNGWS